MPSIKINKKILLDELDLPHEAIHDEITGTSRWSERHWCVFEYQGKFYGAHYSVGKTEQQEEYAWDHEEEVKCTEVEQVEVTTKVWKEKK